MDQVFLDCSLPWVTSLLLASLYLGHPLLSSLPSAPLAMTYLHRGVVVVNSASRLN